MTKTEQTEIDSQDICGLCGQPGADKFAHPEHWPGERIPDGPMVHEECEKAECERAHHALNDQQRKDALRAIWNRY